MNGDVDKVVEKLLENEDDVVMTYYSKQTKLTFKITRDRARGVDLEQTMKLGLAGTHPHIEVKVLMPFTTEDGTTFKPEADPTK